MNKTLKKRHLLGSLVLIGWAVTGCIHTNETVVRDEARVRIEFENDAAGRIFYETLSRIQGAEDKTVSRSEVSLPVVFRHERKVVHGPNRGFNDAVRRCDTNADRRITETEARIFAGTSP